MKIGVNCFLLQPSIGGLKQYFQTLFRELLETDSVNEYVFFYFDHNIPELEKLGTDRWKEGAVLLSNQEAIWQHLDMMDLYFCPFGAIWPIPVPVPSVVTIVDLQEKYYPDFFTLQDHWNRDYYYYGSSHQADAVITISDFSKQSIVRFHGVDPCKIHVVYLSAQNNFVEALRHPRSLTSPLPDNFIFYPANHWKHKNHECLLDGLKILKEKYGLTLSGVFTGFSQANGVSVMEKAKEMGLDVRWYEYLDVEELAFIYRNAGALCYPSLFEGFGIPLVEAMLSGCPIVCSNSSSIPEVVGDAALLFEPGDPEACACSLKKIFEDPGLKNNLVSRGYVQAKRFSPQKMANDHRSVFEIARHKYSRLSYYRNRFIFNPLHDRRMLKRKPQSGG